MGAMIDFAIVGEPKSGTTALAEFLSGHPEICMSVPKEPAYFATDLMGESDRFHGAPMWFEFRTEEDYAATFAACRDGQLRGDGSTAYLHSREAAANIHRANPDARIVVMLREPVSFMQALHAQFVNETTEDEPDFARALAKEPARRAGREIPPRVRCPSFLHYRERARYAPQLERFFAVFPRKQVLVLVFEEFRADNAARVPAGARVPRRRSGARAGLPRGARPQDAAQRPPQPGAQLAAPEAGRVPRPRP